MSRDALKRVSTGLCSVRASPDGKCTALLHSARRRGLACGVWGQRACECTVYRHQEWEGKAPTVGRTCRASTAHHAPRTTHRALLPGQRWAALGGDGSQKHRGHGLQNGAARGAAGF
jgi:hypothetical protein